MKPTHSNAHWWLGVADLLAHGVQHGVVKLQRIHLSVADESFRVLEAIPATRHTLGGRCRCRASFYAGRRERWWSC